MRGEGVRCRLSRVPGETSKGVLDHAITLPAVLGDIDVTEEAQHTEFLTVSGGQFSQGQLGRRARMLRSIDLEGLALEWNASWLIERGLNPVKVRNTLEGVLRSRQPFELLLTLREGDSAATELRMSATVRSWKWTLKQGERDTRYYQLTIREWRPLHSQRRGTHEGRKPGVRFPTTTRLKASDTLESLAHEFYGRYSLWRHIRDANGISKRFGQRTPLVSLARYKVGSRVKLPKIRAR